MVFAYLNIDKVQYEYGVKDKTWLTCAGHLPGMELAVREVDLGVLVVSGERGGRHRTSPRTTAGVANTVPQPLLLAASEREHESCQRCSTNRDVGWTDWDYGGGTGWRRHRSS